MDLGPIHLERPEWLLLIPLVLGGILWMSRRSIAGLGTFSRRMAVAIRVVLACLLVVVLASPSWRKETKDVGVTLVLDASRSMPAAARAHALDWTAQAAAAHQRPGDRLGHVSVARDATIQQLPSATNRSPESTTNPGAGDATNIAQGIQTALAAMSADAAHRILLVSDGNETDGSVLSAAQQALAAGVPIDVAPADFRHDNEVVVERVVAPATARMGQTLNVRVFIQATRPARGRLTLLRNGEPVDLDLASPATGMDVDLLAGLNPLSVPVPDPGAGRQEFRAVFEPTIEAGQLIGDSVLENNAGSAVTFISGQGLVLVVAESDDESADMLRVLQRARIEAVARPSHAAFASLDELSGYDGVILLNQSAYNFSHGQQEDLRRFVHDAGGGLIMVGGPDSFGAGGWIGSPLEDALPVRLDPPQRRNTPRGACVIVMDVSGSMAAPVGNSGMTQIDAAAKSASASLRALTPRDLIGVVTFDSSHRVLVPLRANADPTDTSRRIFSMGPGGGTNMFPAIRAAAQMLIPADAGLKHIIVLSDGQTEGDASEGMALARLMSDAGITMSTVAIGDGADRTLMARLASASNGRFYPVDSDDIEGDLPAIFIKETMHVARSLIWEGTPFAPTVTAAGSEPMRGIMAVPPIGGYVIAADREGLSMVTMRGGSDNDPIAAHWQYGLGRAVAFLSDSSSRWGASWVGWDDFQQFWEQHIRWAMMPTGDASIHIATENRGDRTIVTLDALTPDGQPLNFADFDARVAGPENSAQLVELRQVAPGRYQGEFASGVAGSYIVSAGYQAQHASGTLSGTARAAVVRSFADEFRSLEDNAALLHEVARLTGGRTLDLSMAADLVDLWTRTDLKFPVTTRSIWLALATAAVGIFLLDVAIRRVRFEPLAMLAMLMPGRRNATAPFAMGALHAAKQRSREAAQQTHRAPTPAQPTPPSTAMRPHSTQPAPTTRPIIDAPSPAPRATPSAPPIKPAAPQPPASEGDAMSRLLRAKRQSHNQDDQT